MKFIDKIFPTGENAMQYLQEKIVGDKSYKVHRPPFKVIINPVLRKIQFWTDFPYVIVSEFTKDFKKFNGYGFKKIKRKNK